MTHGNLCSFAMCFLFVSFCEKQANWWAWRYFCRAQYHTCIDDSGALGGMRMVSAFHPVHRTLAHIKKIISCVFIEMCPECIVYDVTQPWLPVEITMGVGVTKSLFLNSALEGLD